MDHGQQAMELTGSFQGHVLPGGLFLLWAAWWLLGAVRTHGRALLRSSGVMEGGWAVPLGKVAFPLVGVVAELAPGGWVWTRDSINNWQHATMYAGFALSGVVDLLARRGRIAPWTTWASFAGACFLSAFLFGVHGHMGGAADLVHRLLAATFVGAGLAALLEFARPGMDLGWLRVAALALVGSWFIQIAWVLYRAEYDLSDPNVMMRVSLFFSWHVLAVAVVALAVRLLVVPRVPEAARSGTVRGPGKGAGPGDVR